MANKDHLTSLQRSVNMALIKNKDIKPEIKLRSFLHSAGLRFRKNVKNLPGSPDLVFPKYKIIIFLHGCYWHRHSCKRGQSTPNTRKEFWDNKFRTNVQRDQRNMKILASMGWKVLIVWECEIKSQERMQEVIHILKGVNTSFDNE